MKILYMNLLCNLYGHKRLDENLINCLSGFSDLYVAAPEGWYDKKIKNVHYLIIPDYTQYLKNKGSYYWYHYKNYLIAQNFDNKYNFDYILFASFETRLSFLLSRFKNSKRRVFIIHHNNIDVIDDSYIKKFFFEHTCRDINHIVLANFIREHLIKDYHFSENKVYYLPHPLNTVSSGNCCKEYDCVGISNSNSEEWIKRIINFELNYKSLQDNKIKVVLRSKKFSFDNGYLKIINGRLSDYDYYKYITSSKVIFLPFPDTFKYRMSGSVVDALSNRSVVLGSSIPVFNDVSKKYPNICKTVSDPFEMYQFISKQNNYTINSFQEKEFLAFINEHSNDNVSNALKKCFD